MLWLIVEARILVPARMNTTIGFTPFKTVSGVADLLGPDTATQL